MSFRPTLPLTIKKPKNPPAQETYKEAEFLKDLGECKKIVTVKLNDGETVEGWIEYYDANMIRLTREGLPNLFIFKHDISYIAEGTLRRSAPARRPAP
jgi:host factor-I protein